MSSPLMLQRSYTHPGRILLEEYRSLKACRHIPPTGVGDVSVDTVALEHGYLLLNRRDRIF